MEPRQRFVCVLVGLVAFLFFVVGTAATPQLLDSAEFVAASFGLGVAHPPGEPLALLWTRAVMLLPIGSLAFRAGLAQGVAGAVAAMLVFALAMHAQAALGLEERIGAKQRVLAAALGALLFAIAPGVLVSGFRPEVYALAAVLSLGAFWCALRARTRGDARPALVAAFLIGLGLGNHPLIAGAVGISAVAAAWPVVFAGRFLRPRPRVLLGGIIAFVAGALVLLAVPLRTHAIFRADAVTRAGTLLWGDARTLPGLWWVLSARTFADKADLVHGRDAPDSLPFLFMEELGVPGAILALAGSYAIFRRPGARTLGALLLLAATGAVGAALAGGLDPSNPDIRGYLAPAWGVAAILAAVGAALVSLIIPRPAWRNGLFFVACVTVIGAGAGRAGRLSLHHARAADALSAEILHALPPRAVLLTGHYETAFLLAHHRLVQGQRPDIAWVHLGWQHAPGYAERVLGAAPELAPVIGARGAPAFAHLVTLAMRRPVHIEPAFTIAPELEKMLEPGGLTWRVRGATELPAALPPNAFGFASGASMERWWREAEGAHARELYGYLAYRLYLDARLACVQGRPEAETLLALLHERLPEDTMVAALAAQCAR